MALTAKDYGPHPIDLRVGAALRRRRIAAGFSQQRLAEAIGVTFQQVQKYESAGNRISASRLWQIAGVLGIGVADLFEGVEAPPSRQAAGCAADREVIDLMDTFSRIRDSGTREALRALSRAVTDAQTPH